MAIIAEFLSFGLNVTPERAEFDGILGRSHECFAQRVTDPAIQNPDDIAAADASITEQFEALENKVR